MSPIPATWSLAPLGSFADVKLGKMLDKAKNKGEAQRYLRNVNVRWGSFELGDVLEMRFLPEEMAAFEVRDGDLMVCEGGEPGRCAVWRGGPTDLKFQKAIHRVRLPAGFVPEFFSYYLRHAVTSGTLDDVTAGSTIAHLTKQVLEKVEVPVAAEWEQRRIVAKIDALLVRSKRARADLERVEALVERAMQTVRARVFQDLRSAGMKRVTDITRIVTKGQSPNWQGFQYVKAGCPFIRSQNVRNGHLDLSGLVYLDPSFGKARQSSQIAAGDVLLNIVGASIGRAAVATSEIAGANCNQAVAIIRLADPADAPFLCEWLLSPECQRLISDGSVDVARANFSLAGIRDLSLPWPTKEQRQAAVTKIETALSALRKVLDEASRSAVLLSRLDQSFLARAFRGELVPQDEHDEPADVLLERVRAERTADRLGVPRRLRSVAQGDENDQRRAGKAKK